MLWEIFVRCAGRDGWHDGANGSGWVRVEFSSSPPAGVVDQFTWANIPQEQ